MNDEVLILIIALIIDAIGEYPNKIHPVVWVGKIIDFFDKRRKKRSGKVEFIEGLLLLIFVSFIFILAITYILRISSKYEIISIIVQAFLLKASFSIGSLIRHVKRCETGNIENLKKNVSMIVSRDVKNLSKEQLYSAAIESGAENIVDSIVSPIFYFMLFGVPGAFFFRIVNTFDAMIGYRNERYEYFGKFAARMDDVMNFIPARITGFILLLFSPKRVWNNLKKYRKIKINGMYTIASMSAILNVTLEKPRYYRIEGERDCNISDVKRSINYILYVSIIWIAIVMVVMFIYGLPWWS